MKDLDPPVEPVRRYERRHPRELIHIDIRKLGRFERGGHPVTGNRTGQSRRHRIGRAFVRIANDDISSIAFSQIPSNEKKEGAITFLKAALAYYE